MHTQRLLPSREVEKLTSFSRSTLDRKVASGDFPQPVKISDRRKAYPEAAVQRWIAQHLGEVA